MRKEEHIVQMKSEIQAIQKNKLEISEKKIDFKD